jgi:hypothetical protein
MPTAVSRGKRQAAEKPPTPAKPDAAATPENQDRGGPPEGVTLLPGPPPHQPYKPTNEDEEFLFAPTDRPNEHVFQGARGGYPAPPPDLGRWLPKLQAAAEGPDAPPELHYLIRRIREALGG